MAVSAGDTHEVPAVAVLDAEGMIVGLYQGMDLVDETLSMLEGLGIDDA